MPVKWLQNLYDGIKGFIAPKWIKVILLEIQEIIVSMLLNIGKEYLKQLEDKIIEAEDSGMSDTAKFDYVFKWAKSNIPNLKDGVANLLIEIVLTLLKDRNFVRVV